MSEEKEYPYPLMHGSKVVCQICGKAFGKIMPTHLDKHGISYTEYFEKYPDSPKNPDSYTSATFTQKDSMIFIKDEKTDRVRYDDAQEFNMLEEDDIKDEITNESVIDFTNVNKHKVGILKHLHNQFRYLENNYIVKKENIQGRLEYEFITDMADPVSKIIFDFPFTYWHNNDIVPDPNKIYKLEKDGWDVVIFSMKTPSVDDIKKQFEGSITD